MNAETYATRRIGKVTSKEDIVNTERLHSLIHLFIEANNKHKFVNLLQNVTNTYTQSVQTPDPQNAQAFGNASNALHQAADEFPVGSLSPSRRKLLEAIGGSVYYGNNLTLRIHDIISKAETPSNAVVAMQDLQARMTAFFPIVQALDDSLTKLGVGLEDTPKDSAEIEVLIPESMVDGHLDGFAKETSFLNETFSDIREVVTGKRTSLDIRSLGSGSVELYLIVDLATGAQILSFVTAVVLLINSISQTRRNRESLKQQDAPDKIIKDIKSWEDKRIKEQIDKLRDELLEQYTGEEGRKNELSNALSKSLRRLADRIDRGMDIDVTTAATVDEKEGEGSAADAKQISDKRSWIKSINNAADTISQIERNKEPVLQLAISDEQETQ